MESRRGWLRRSHHHTSSAHSAVRPEATIPDVGADGGDDKAPDGADAQASLDQVLRRAAEARDAERTRDD